MIPGGIGGASTRPRVRSGRQVRLYEQPPPSTTRDPAYDSLYREAFLRRMWDSHMAAVAQGLA